MTCTRERVSSVRITDRMALGITLTIEEDQIYTFDPFLRYNDPEAEYEAGEKRYYVNGVRVAEWTLIQRLENGNWACESLEIKEQKH